jgi:hypothetical protein
MKRNINFVVLCSTNQLFGSFLFYAHKHKTLTKLPFGGGTLSSTILSSLCSSDMFGCPGPETNIEILCFYIVTGVESSATSWKVVGSIPVGVTEIYH